MEINKLMEQKIDKTELSNSANKGNCNNFENPLKNSLDVKNI